jgi:molybdate transport system permease protein
MRILWQVMLPLAWPGVAAGTVLTFLRALGEFGATLMIAGNVPGKTQTAPVAIFFAVEAGEYTQPLFWALVIVVLAVTFICVINALSRRFEA